jgi:hypothetical protein
VLLLVDVNSVAARSFYGTHMRAGVPAKSFMEKEFVRAFLSSLFKHMDAASGSLPGRAILCLDDAQSWREAVLPSYKSGRKEAKSKVPWAEYCDCLLETCAGIKKSMPFAVVRRRGYEADDLIAYFSRMTEKVTIVSSDEDMLQLWEPDRVSIYSQDKLQFSKPEPDADSFLQVLTCCGCDTDDVPSIVPKWPDGKPIFRFGEKTVLASLDPAGRCGLSDSVWAKMTGAEAECFAKDWKRNRLLVDLMLSPVHGEEISAEFGRAGMDEASAFVGSRINIGGSVAGRFRALMELYGTTS